jgi:AAA+ ATPase superfamily predicted ATPase
MTVIIELTLMPTHLRTFETRGPVEPSRNYVVPRTAEIADLVQRIKDGRYIVIFAPRQTGKTTFFRWALESLDETYLPIQLNFEEYKDLSPEDFYHYFKKDIQKEIENSAQIGQEAIKFLENYSITSYLSMRHFFEQLAGFLKKKPPTCYHQRYQSPILKWLTKRF